MGKCIIVLYYKVNISLRQITAHNSSTLSDRNAKTLITNGLVSNEEPPTRTDSVAEVQMDLLIGAIGGNEEELDLKSNSI